MPKRKESRYFLSHAAEQDIEEIITYMAGNNPKSAHIFLDELYDAMKNLSDYPELGHLRENLTDRPVKFWPFKWHYLIIYKPKPPIEIVRVLSGYRDIANLI